MGSVASTVTDAANSVADGVKGAANTVANSASTAVNTVGDGANAAVDTVRDGVSTAVNKSEDGLSTAGSAIKNTATDASNTIANGAVSATGDALAAMDPEGRARQARLRAAAKLKIDEFEAQSQEKQAEAAVANKANVETQVAPLRQQASDFTNKLASFVTTMDAFHQQWEDNAVGGYNSMVIQMVNGLVGTNRIAMVLRGHSVESIRTAKLEEPALRPSDPRDYLASALAFSQSNFQAALKSAEDILTAMGDIDAKVRELDESTIPRFMVQLINFGKERIISMDTLRQTIHNSQGVIDSMVKANREQKKEISDHLDMAMGDDAAGVGKSIAEAFGASFPDDWEDFINSHYQNISGNSGTINTQTTQRDVAQGVLNIAEPIEADVNHLNDSSGAIRDKIAKSMTMLTDLTTRLETLHISVGNLAESYSHITDSVHFDMSTDRYVQKLTDVVTAAVNIDFCANRPAQVILDQLRQVTIPAAPSTGVQRGGDDDTVTAPAASQDRFQALSTALQLPPHDPFPEFHDDPPQGSDPAPPRLIDNSHPTHVHVNSSVQSLYNVMDGDIGQAATAGFDKIYTP